MNEEMSCNCKRDCLLVFFEEPFWIGVFEYEENGKLSVCKVTFGKEPKDQEIQEFILNNYYKLRFSPSVDSVNRIKERVNPKRMQREAVRQVAEAGIGTKSQQALKLLQEQNKTERKQKVQEQKELQKQFQYELRQQKKREKHRGR